MCLSEEEMIASFDHDTRKELEQGMKEPSANHTLYFAASHALTDEKRRGKVGRVHATTIPTRAEQYKRCGMQIVWQQGGFHDGPWVEMMVQSIIKGGARCNEKGLVGKPYIDNVYQYGRGIPCSAKCKQRHNDMFLMSSSDRLLWLEKIVAVLRVEDRLRARVSEAFPEVDEEAQRSWPEDTTNMAWED